METLVHAFGFVSIWSTDIEVVSICKLPCRFKSVQTLSSLLPASLHPHANAFTDFEELSEEYTKPATHTNPIKVLCLQLFTEPASAVPTPEKHA